MTSLTLATQLAGVTSPHQKVTLTNSGSANLTVSSVAASGGYSVTNNCATLAPGAACVITVKFISALVGADPGTITIRDNAASSPQLVTLSGSTVAPFVLSPAKVAFTSTAVGTTSPVQSLRLTNRGSGLTISTIATSGDYLQSNNCPASLASGASCTVNVQFHPTAVGTITGAVSVLGSTYGVSAKLSGTGTGTV